MEAPVSGNDARPKWQASSYPLWLAVGITEGVAACNGAGFNIVCSRLCSQRGLCSGSFPQQTTFCGLHTRDPVSFLLMIAIRPTISSEVVEN
jgi:hypothetical protein